MMAPPMRARLLPFLLAQAFSLPAWSWDSVQTYVHCANRSGDWNPDAVAVLAKQSFVVFEKQHGLFAPPVNTSAEDKIVAACRMVKAASLSTDCYIYTETDWARTFYTIGHDFDAHPSWELHAADGWLINTTDVETVPEPINGTTKFNYTFNAYDFGVVEARDRWVRRVTDAVATGVVDGVFIDGNRGGWSSGILGPASDSTKAAWRAGLNASHRQLAAALGPNATIISNYATPEALAVCSGGMMERGGSGVDSIKQLQSLGSRTCGLYAQPCLVDYHAQYADRSKVTFANNLAAFLVGMEKHAYFGAGGGWMGDGPSACATWLKEWPEYSYSLGEPAGPAVEESDGVYSRAFSSGTRVWLNASYSSKSPGGDGKSCIYWSNGEHTGDACPSRGTVVRSYSELKGAPYAVEWDARSLRLGGRPCVCTGLQPTSPWPRVLSLCQASKPSDCFAALTPFLHPVPAAHCCSRARCTTCARRQRSGRPSSQRPRPTASTPSRATSSGSELPAIVASTSKPLL